MLSPASVPVLVPTSMPAAAEKSLINFAYAPAHGQWAMCLCTHVVGVLFLMEKCHVSQQSKIVVDIFDSILVQGEDVG